MNNNLEDHVFTVSEFNDLLKNIFDETPLFHGLKIKGELNGFKRHSSGHFFFSLRDENSTINCVIYSFNYKNSFSKLKDGDLVEATGSLTVFNKRGTYNFIITNLVPSGIGDILLKKQQLLEKLDKLGYFDPEKKKPIPLFPKTIGIITSPTGAAIKDIEKNIRLRNKNVDLILFPATVQGSTAVSSILKAIELTKNYDIDTLIIGRGGGSNEDLSAFDDENIAIALHELNIPVISAVGHEINKSVCDYVADLSVSTPTAAAIAAVQDTSEVIEYLKKTDSDLDLMLNSKISRYKNQINEIRNMEFFSNLPRYIESINSQIKLIEYDLNNKVLNLINNYRSSLNQYDTLLNALNPQNVLKKGYSIIKNQENKILSTVEEIKANKQLTLIMSDGKIDITKEQ